MKRMIQLSIIGLVLLLSVAVAGAAPAAQEDNGETIYVVEEGDGLIQLARVFYDDVSAYPLIIEATNARAKVDSSFIAISDPNIILVGQKLVIPAPSQIPEPPMEESDDSMMEADEDPMMDDGDDVLMEDDTDDPDDMTVEGPGDEEMMADEEDSDMETSPLAGTRWTLTSMSEGTLVDGTPVTLDFVDESNIAATTGCNNVATSYETSGIRISFGPIITTLIACPGGITEQENSFIQVLEGAAFYEVTDGGALWLFDENRTRTATFDPASGELAGTSWNVISYNNGSEAVVTVLTGSSITAVFAEDGRLSGSAGCNNYTSPYSTEGTEIAIGPVAATRLLCPDEDVMDQENAYLNALETAATYQITGNAMEMRTADGAIVAIFSRAAVQDAEDDEG